MIDRYLHSSKRLKAVFLLVDIRHAPGENDKIMYDWIVSSGYKPIIICTKLDKIKRSQQAKNVKLIKDMLNVESGTKIVPFSAVSKQGKEDIWGFIQEAIAD